MTESQRAEFEKQKHISENQLREMYFGKNNSKEGLKVPPFIKASQTEQKKSPVPETPPKTNSQPTTKPSAQPSFPKKQNILELINLKNLVLDDDRILLVSLCLLLSHEEADELLIMALIYIML